jgi:hypothetical protein
MLVIDKESKLQLDDTIVLHAIPELDKYWAFNIESGDQYTLNGSAFFLLIQFRNLNNVWRALAEFADHFGIDKETAEEDGLPLLIDYYGLKFFKGE